jgi:hypothetical protein
MNNPFSVRSTFDGTDAITTHQIRERVVAEATDAGADLLTRVTERATNNAIETIAALPRGVRHAIETQVRSAQRLEAAIQAGKKSCSCTCNGAGAGGACSCGGRKCACKGRGMFRRTAGGQWITEDVCEDGRCCDYL